MALHPTERSREPYSVDGISLGRFSARGVGRRAGNLATEERRLAGAVKEGWF